MNTFQPSGFTAYIDSKFTDPRAQVAENTQGPEQHLARIFSGSK